MSNAFISPRGLVVSIWGKASSRGADGKWRALKVGGLLMFSCYGPDTLRELKSAFAACDGAAHVHDFIDMVHVYPTMAEALKIAALSFFKDVSKLSCCAE